MSRGSKLVIVVLLAGIVAAVWMTQGMQHRPRRVERKKPDNGAPPVVVSNGSGQDVAYVGSEACKACHQEISKQYEATAMGRSMALADSESVEAATFDAGPRTYHISADSGGHMVHAETMEWEGATIYALEKKIAYILGSGKRGRSYLIQENDRLYQSPIGWYATDGGQWDLSPGYDSSSHPGFDRIIDDGCLYCHAGQTNTKAATKDRYQDPVFLELAIGCERCHGPGEAHVAFHASDDTTNLQDHMVNPANFDDAALRDAICNQCHLLGQSVIRRKGKTFFSYRPGQRLEESFVMLARPKSLKDSMSAVSQVEQMRASQCYIKSEQKLGCTSCHDPHFSPSEQNRIAYFRDRCMECHQDQGCSLDEASRNAKQNSCIECHMPRQQTADVPHTSLTHHGIIRPGKTFQLPNQADDLDVFSSHKESLTELEIDRAKGITLMSAAWAAADRKLAVEAMRHLFDSMPISPEPMEERLKSLRDPVTLEELGSGYFMLERFLFAEICWQRLLELQPENLTALLGLAKLAWEQKDSDKYEAMLKKLDFVAPSSPDYLTLQLQLSFTQNDPERAVQWGEKLVAANPTNVAGREMLMEAYRKTGQSEKAEEQAAKIKALREAFGKPAATTAGELAP